MFLCCCTAPEERNVVQHIPLHSTLEEPPRVEETAVVIREEAAVEEPEPENAESAPAAPSPEAPEQTPETLAPEKTEKESASDPIDAPTPTTAVGGAPGAEAAPVPQVATEKTDEPEPMNFKATVKKSGKDDMLGMDLDIVSSSCVMVIRVSGGAAMTYNKSVAAELKIQPADFIMSVNGLTNDTTKMIREANQNTKLELQIKRPPAFSVEIDKLGRETASFGIGVDFLASGRSVMIKRIDDGLVTQWNKAHPDREIRVGDRIISVNGFNGDPDTMLNMAAKEASVLLKLVRP